MFALVALLTLGATLPAAADQASVLARLRAGRLPTLGEIEPRRDVAAERWQHLYCTRWDDGCVRCERASAGEKPRCAPIGPDPDPERPSAECRRGAIACQDRDSDVGPRVCQVIVEVTPAPSRVDPARLAGYTTRTCNPGVCTAGRHADLDSLVAFDAQVAREQGWRPFYRHHRPRPVADEYCAVAKRDVPARRR